MGDQITTAEAAKITHHRGRRGFVRWAKENAPHILTRFPGQRGYLVDQTALLTFLGLNRSQRDPKGIKAT